MKVSELKSYRSEIKGLAGSLENLRPQLVDVVSGGRYRAQVRRRAKGYVDAIDGLLRRIDNEVQAVNEAITEASQPPQGIPAPPDPQPSPVPAPYPQPSPYPGPGDQIQPREPVRQF